MKGVRPGGQICSLWQVQRKPFGRSGNLDPISAEESGSMHKGGWAAFVEAAEKYCKKRCI